MSRRFGLAAFHLGDVFDFSKSTPGTRRPQHASSRSTSNRARSELAELAQPPTSTFIAYRYFIGKSLNQENNSKFKQCVRQFLVDPLISQCLCH